MTQSEIDATVKDYKLKIVCSLNIMEMELPCSSCGKPSRTLNFFDGYAPGYLGYLCDDCHDMAKLDE